jgi:hypothetical protein
MKFLKLSKTSWLILAAGVFVVVLAGLGFAVSQQMQEKGQLEEDLSVSLESLDKLDNTELQQHLDELQQMIDEEQLQLDEARERLDKTVVSVDVTDKFFSIADYCGVTVMSMSTSPVQNDEYEGIGLSMTALNSMAVGELDDIVQFVISLNNDFTTGKATTFQIDIPQESDNATVVNVQMFIYSCEGTE